MNIQQLDKDLKEILGDRATVSPHERWFYRSDVLKMPSWIDRMVRSTPDAVVAPRDAREVDSVLTYCSERGIPVTPRGAGSSGLFGSVPKRAGIVLDLRWLDGDPVIDRDRLSVSCSSGMTWWELDQRLKRDGLTLKSYPSSARSATLAGWIMTTGLGIGNIKYGPVHDQVLSAQVVVPDGTISDLNESNWLGTFVGSEGLLGVMTRVTLEVRLSSASSRHTLLYFDRIGRLFEFVQALTRSAVLPYSVEFFDDAYLGMLKSAGYWTTAFSRGGGVALVTYEGSRVEDSEAEQSLLKNAAGFSAELREGGDNEWAHRFNMLRVRRAVPSLIPGSVHLPLAKLEAFYARMARLKKRSIGLLGHVVSEDDCVLMPMIATDDTRGLEYALALHTPAELSNLALSLRGGPGGGLGTWNSAYRNSTGMKAKADAIASKKKEVDPKGILNPGMWTDAPWLLKPSMYRVAISLAHAADRVLPRRRPGDRPSLESKEFVDCVQCGYCMGYCPTRRQWLSSTPRGRILSARENLLPAAESGTGQEREAVDDIFECTLCGRCRVDCSVEVKSPEMWADLRCKLAQAGSSPESLNALAKTIADTHNLAAKPNEQRGRWADSLKLEHRKAVAETVYFVGCVTSFYPMVQDVARSFAQILNKAGMDFAILAGDEWCCGYPLLSAGQGKAAVSHIEANLARVKAAGAKRLLTTCTGCYRMWKQDYPRLTGNEVPFEVMHSTQIIPDLIETGKITLGEMKTRVTYHDPCDLGRNAGIYEKPRSIISSIPGIDFIELESNRQYCNCCGSGGDLLASNQTLSLEIAARKVQEVLATGAESVVTACPSCIRAITMARLAQKAPFKILDIAQLTWNSMKK